MKLVEALLLTLCVATLALLGETAAVMFVEGAHYTAVLRHGGNALLLWLTYAAIFCPFGVVGWFIGLPGRRLGETRGRAAALMLALVALALPLVHALVLLLRPIRSVYETGTGKGGILTLLLLAIAAMGLVALRGSARATRVWTSLIAVGIAALAVGNVLATHDPALLQKVFIDIVRIPAELVGRGLPHIAAAALATVVLALPLLVALRGAPERSLAGPLSRSLGVLSALLLGLPYVTSMGVAGRGGPVDEQTRTRPSILLIVVDTLRADHVAGFGAADDATPSLARLGRDAISFERAYAPAPWTLPSFASLLTSTYPSEHHAGFRRDPRWSFWHGMRSSIDTLAEQLSAHSYWTGAVLTNPMLSPVYGVDRGFQSYENLASFRSYHPVVAGLRERGLMLWREYLPADDQTARVRDMLRRARDSGRPFFVMAHYLDPHRPYGPPGSDADREGWGAAWPSRLGGTPDELRRIVGKLYRDEVGYLDRSLGVVLEELRTEGLYDDLLLVLTADHGEDLAERTENVATGVRDHGHSLFDELLRVPLLIKLPGNDGAGTRRSDAASLIDVAPTILAAAGIEVPAGFRGRDLLASGLDAADDSPMVFAEAILHGDQRKAAIRGDEKVILHTLPPDPETAKGYDLTADPGERSPHALEATTGRFQPLYEALVEFAARGAEAPDEGPGIEVDALMKQRLEALGYVE